MIYLVIKLLLGAAAGYIATSLMNGKQNTIWINMVLGIIGSFVGHFLAGLIGISATGIAGFAISVAGACVVIWAARKFAK